MSNIAELGERIFRLQRDLGLKNPDHHQPGILKPNGQQSALFDRLPHGSEVHDLYQWRNGAVTKGIPMTQLWLKPGLYLVPAEEAVLSNDYCSKYMDDWSPAWYPLLESGGAEMLFFDASNVSDGRFAVFDNDPEFTPVVSKIYDSIGQMFETILECYAQGVYNLNAAGRLQSDFAREIEIARRINKGSEFWRRTDLL